MKFNQSEISDIIQLAWDDQTDFSHITKIYEINEGDVKKIMKNNIKRKSYEIWRKRISEFTFVKKKSLNLYDLKSNYFINNYFKKKSTYSFPKIIYPYSPV